MDTGRLESDSKINCSQISSFKDVGIDFFCFSEALAVVFVDFCCPGKQFENSCSLSVVQIPHSGVVGAFSWFLVLENSLKQTAERHFQYRWLLKSRWYS